MKVFKSAKMQKHKKTWLFHTSYKQERFAFTKASIKLDHLEKTIMMTIYKPNSLQFTVLNATSL